MDSGRTHVDQLYEYSAEVSKHLGAQQPSLLLTAEELFRKSLLVAAASYFERRVKEILLDYVRESSGANDRLVEFVRDKVTKRGYHTLFAWDAQNANQFWGSFGESFASAMKERVRHEPALGEGVRAFIELGRVRNLLVHEDFGAYSLDKTSPEIYESYRMALGFVESLPGILRGSA